MRRRSYSPSPPRGGYDRSGRSPSPRGRYGGLGGVRDFPTSLLVRNLRHDCRQMYDIIGEFESLHRDLMIGFGTWEFSPMDLENPITNNEGSIHQWQGDEVKLVPVSIERYIVKQLPWINYHEISGAGHLFPYADGMVDAVVKSLLTVRT